MKTKNGTSAAIARAQGAVLDSFLMTALTALIMHAVSGGTVTVPVTNELAAAVNAVVDERSAEEISETFLALL